MEFLCASYEKQFMVFYCSHTSILSINIITVMNPHKQIAYNRSLITVKFVVVLPQRLK